MKKQNKKKKTKLKKSKYIKYCIIIIILISISTGIYFFLNSEDNDTKLTILEKKWIMDNKNTLIDINVPNNLSIIADNGSGIVFDYLKKIEKETELKFNKKSYDYLNDKNMKGFSVLVLDNSDKLKENDTLITEDNYILASLNEGEITDLKTVYNKKIGVLKDEKSIISKAIGTTFTYEEYDSLDEIIKDLSKKKIDYLIAPRYYSLETLVSNKIYINYTFNNFTNKVVLRPTSDKKLKSISEKFLESFKNENYTNSYEKEFMKFYLANTETTDLEASTLSRKVYNYGYLKNSTYNIRKGKKLYGFAGEYINLLSNMANIELNTKEYKNKEKLNKAIENGEIDIAFIDFDYANTNGKFTINAFTPSLIALSKTNYPISDKEGLNNRKLYTLKNTYLESYIKENYNGSLTTIKKATSNIAQDGILVLDELDYYYNADKKEITKYYALLKDEYPATYKFFVKNNEEVLYDFMNFLIMYSDSNDLKINSINKLIESSDTKHNFTSLYLLVILVIIIPIILLFLVVILSKSKKNINLLRKEDRLKYSDMLTSLKNRNYLRAHIEEWDEAKITPRTVIIVDLNKLKYVNDNYGSKEGNHLIKKAAAILINTQLEKSEIIRTDGNEFLIYLIGYNEKQVNTYINKLSREFEKLPYGFGAAIGYSMITDEIKTIDDAINEASIEMREDKEKNYK